MGILMQDPFSVHQLFVYCDICTHTYRNKILHHILSHKFYLFLSRQFNRKCNLYLSCHLRPCFLLNLLYPVPQNFTLTVLRRSKLWQHYFCVDNTLLLGVIMHISGFGFRQFLSRTIGSRRNRTFATATTDDFYR